LPESVEFALCSFVPTLCLFHGGPYVFIVQAPIVACEFVDAGGGQHTVIDKV
jgi:hypothetical protein